MKIGEARARVLVVPTYARSPELRATPIADLVELYVPNGDLPSSATAERIERYIRSHNLRPSGNGAH